MNKMFRGLSAAVAAAMLVTALPMTALADGKNLEWETIDGKDYWYENGTIQGTVDDPQGVYGDGTNRGREIWDSKYADSVGDFTAGWFWLDSVYGGAKAKNKEVWMPYIFQDEDSFSDAEIAEKAAGSVNPSEHIQSMSAQVADAIRNKTGKWVRYDSKGAMIKGWYTVTQSEVDKNSDYQGQLGNKYYYDYQTGLMAKGIVSIEGKNYKFDEITGVCQGEANVSGYAWELQKAETKSISGDTTSIQEFTYHPNGELATESDKEYSDKSDGTGLYLNSEYNFTYNSSGYQTSDSYTFYNEDGSVNSTETLSDTYNGYDLVRTDYVYTSDEGTSKYYYTYENNAKHNPVKSSYYTYYGDTAVKQSDTVYTYDGNDYLILEETTSTSGQITNKTEYIRNNKGKILKSYTYVTDGYAFRLAAKKVYTYESDGTHQSGYTCYSYDSNGTETRENWNVRTYVEYKGNLKPKTYDAYTRRKVNGEYKDDAYSTGYEYQYDAENNKTIKYIRYKADSNYDKTMSYYRQYADNTSISKPASTVGETYVIDPYYETYSSSNKKRSTTSYTYVTIAVTN